MGINGLWTLLAPAAKPTSLYDLAIQKGFIENISGVRAYRVGIDASAWIYAICYRHGNTKNPELASFFARCSHLFRLPLLPLFVFDGPARPETKRGKVIRGNDHWLITDMKTMLRGFGFPWVEAPGEAEAELASMSKLGIVDAVITEDSDAIVFGTTTILRLDVDFGQTENVHMYQHCDVVDLGLDMPALVLIALLSGGDYLDGIRNCGPHIASGLARAGLGARLVNGLHASSDRPLEFLSTWREELCDELHTNQSGHLPRRYPSIAAAVPPQFPDLRILDLYLQPLIASRTAGCPTPLVRCDPHLASLAILAEQNFVWGTTVGIMQHFTSHVFPGFGVKALIDAAVAADSGGAVQGCPMIREIIATRKHHASRPPEMRVTVSVPEQIKEVLQSIKGVHDDPATCSETQRWVEQDLPLRVRAWLPLAMLNHVMPHRIKEFQSHRASSVIPGTERGSSAGHYNVIDLTSPSPSPSPTSPIEIIDLTADDSD